MTHYWRKIIANSKYNDEAHDDWLLLNIFFTCYLLIYFEAQVGQRGDRVNWKYALDDNRAGARGTYCADLEI